MRGRTPIGVLGLSLLLAATAHADTRVAADLNIHLGSRPAPVVVFEREPDVVLVPGSRVYAVGGLDYDLFRYGQFWYMNDGGYWYRARNYRGPFGAVRYESVPRQIVMVPDRYHHHPMHPLGGPPGQMKRYENANEQGVTIIRNGQRPDDGKGPRRVYKSNGNGQGHGNEKNKGRGH